MNKVKLMAGLFAALLLTLGAFSVQAKVMEPGSQGAAGSSSSDTFKCPPFC